MAIQVQRFSEGAYIITETGEEIPVYEGMEILPTDELVGDIVTIEVDVARDPGADPSSLPAEIAELQQLILEGADPTQVGERTAAGAPGAGETTDGGGTSFVTLDRTGSEVDPTAGYGTIPINLLAFNNNEEIPEIIRPAEEIEGTIPGTTGEDEPAATDSENVFTPQPDTPEPPQEEPPVDPEPEPEEPEQPEEDNSGQNNGWGNGDQDAPGNSEDNNNAENSDNDPPPGISNNPNLNTNEDEDTEDEQDSGDNTETTDDGDSSSDIYGDSDPDGVDDIDEEPNNNDSSDSDTSDNDGTTDEDSGSDSIGQNPGNDKEVGNSPHDGNKGASNDDESPLDAKDILDVEEDIIPGLGKDKEDNPNKGKNNGWGNGDQDAPGNSLDNNNAENNLDGLLSPTEQYYDN